MKTAERLDGGTVSMPAEPPITPGGDENGYAPVPSPYQDDPVGRITGELFFHDPNGNKDGHCTASVVRSRSRSLLVTAAHCVVSVTGQSPIVWQEYPLFVPAYDGTRGLSDEQRAPFGLWPVTRVYVPAIAEVNPFYLLRAEYDLAIAGVFDQLGRPIEDVVGEGFVPLITHDAVLFPKMRVVGYPGAGPYSGAEQYGCESTTATGSVGGIRLSNCGLGSGNSGGPVLVADERQQRVAAVVHSPVDQTRLLEYTYPALEGRASDEHRHRSATGACRGGQCRQK
ncbi:hypothetical protein [Luteibacter sp.]|jgi:V8-like Glu-specific endopeptidase|uniref:trypsin-like serine peptidase n=1 Tax=Luteibacter sp. TaxID=1886636 RepID=UPI002F41A4BD